MSSQQSAGGANEQVPGGDETKEQKGEKKDVVAYETYLRAMDQHKASQRRVEELEGKLKELGEFKEQVDQLQEQKMKEEGNWKALLEQREKKLEEIREELNQTREKNQEYEKNFNDMVKINAFNRAIGGSLKKDEYYNFINTDKIAVNPDTGAIDEESLKQYANEFTNDFKELINFKTKDLPSGAPGGSSELTYSDWLKLPLAEKKKRLPEVMNARK